MSAIVDYQDRATCIIFGDGAGAVLLEPNEDGYGIQDSILRSDGSGSNYLHMKAGGSLKPASIETVMAREHFAYCPEILSQEQDKQLSLSQYAAALADRRQWLFSWS